MLSEAAVQWLEERGLDPDLAAQYGAESRRPPGVSDGDWIALPFLRDDVTVNREYRRLEPKQFRRDKGGVTCFWNESVLDDAGLADQPLIITEGLIDALSMIAAGFQRAVSMPNGSQSSEPRDGQQSSARYRFIEDVAAKLDRVGLIIIAADADAKGYALTEDLSTLLGPARCKFMPYPDGCKDANDVLVRFGAERLRQCVHAARWVNVAGVRRFSEYPPGSDGDPEVWRTGISPSFDKRIGIMPGYTSVWTGIPNHGKSTLLNQVMWSLCQAHGFRAGIATLEVMPNRDYKRVALQYLIGRPREGLGAQGPWTRVEIDAAMAWLEEHIIPIDPNGYADNGVSLEEVEPTVDWFLHAAQTAIVRYGCRVIGLDPWGDIIQTRERGESEHDFIGRTLSRFNRMARMLKAHIAIVAHPKKIEPNRDGGMRMPTPYDIAGSSYFYNKTSLGVTVHRDPETDPETTQPLRGSTRTKVQTWKAKFQDVQCKTGTCHLHYSLSEARFSDS